MLNLMQAEWIKLSRRPMGWILLGVFLLTMLLFLSVEFLVVAAHDGTFTGGNLRISMTNETLTEQFRQILRFPGIFGGVLGQINGVGGICAIILAAGTMGSEYNWGTLRVQLARQPDRGRYLAAKILVLLLVLLIGMVLALIIGALLALLYGSILGDVGSLALTDLLLLPVGMLRALFVFLPYILLTLAVSVIGRSVFAGVAGGLVFLALDGGSGGLSILTEFDNPLVTFLINLLLQRSVNTMIVLNSASYGIDYAALTRLNVETLPSPLHAVILIALYSILFFAYTYYGLTRRDIGGAT